MLFTQRRTRSKNGQFIETDIRSRFMSFVSKMDNCWEWIGAKHYKGYGEFSIGMKKKDKSHRISYRLFIGEIPFGKMICHHCDNRGCVNPSHLFIGDALTNNRDRKIKGRNGHNRKLTDIQIKEIRKLFSTNKFTKEKLGEMFNISGRHIGHIVRRQSWPNISQ